MNETNREAVPGDVEVRLARIAETKLDKAAIEKVLAAFAERNGLSPMQFDENGLIQLELGEDLDIALMPVDSFPGLLAMARLPDEVVEDERVMHQLLAANLSFDDTGGGTFAKLPDSETVAYCRLISLAEQDDRLFERELLGFAETAQDLLDGIELSIDLGDDADEEQPVSAASAELLKV